MHEKQAIVSNGKQNSPELPKVIMIEMFTPDEFHDHLKNLLPYNLYLHINIISLSSHIDQLKNLIGLINLKKLSQKIVVISVSVD